jgi:hypothetical protein
MGSNLNPLTYALYIVVSFEPLQLETPFARICFGHVMSKACQYTTNEALKEIFLKDAMKLYTRL